MPVIKVPTDNPRSEQWKLLSRFSYPPNVTRYAKEKGKRITKKAINYVAGCIRQSEAYFLAALSAPLDIAPLLLYYGATNLTSGAAVLLTGKIQTIFHHGMTLQIPNSSKPRIADYEIMLVRPDKGAIQTFANIFDTASGFANSRSWMVQEVFGSIPALCTEFEACYQGQLPSCLPTRPVKEEMHGVEFLFDEIDMSLLGKYGDQYTTLMSISNLKEAYLPPRINVPSRSAKLYYKRDERDIGIYSIFGEKYLPLNHIKNGKPICPNQLIMMLMGLFALGYLSRYYPGLWNPFIRTDETGERMVIEKFLATCQRYLPNLLLNAIEHARVQFVFEIEREVY